MALWEEAWAAVQASSKYTDDEEGEVASAFATHLQVRPADPISYYCCHYRCTMYDASS